MVEVISFARRPIQLLPLSLFQERTFILCKYAILMHRSHLWQGSHPVRLKMNCTQSSLQFGSGILARVPLVHSCFTVWAACQPPTWLATGAHFISRTQVTP